MLDRRDRLFHKCEPFMARWQSIAEENISPALRIQSVTTGRKLRRERSIRMPGKLSRTGSSAIPAPVFIIVTLSSRLQNPEGRVHRSGGHPLKGAPIVPVRQLGHFAWPCWIHAAAMILRVLKPPDKTSTN